MMTKSLLGVRARMSALRPFGSGDSVIGAQLLASAKRSAARRRLAVTVVRAIIVGAATVTVRNPRQLLL